MGADEMAPASGADPADSLLSAGVHLHDSASDDGPDTAAVRDGFARLGFEVTTPFAGTFSITAPQSVFQSVFSSAAEEIADVGGAGGTTDEVHLPTSDVRPSLGDRADGIKAIFFTAQPDFGPWNP